MSATTITSRDLLSWEEPKPTVATREPRGVVVTNSNVNVSMTGNAVVIYGGYAVAVANDAMPGSPVTRQSIEKSRERGSLIALVRKLFCVGLSWSFEPATTISPSTAKAAMAFLGLFSDDMLLPKIAPDGDGGLLLVWENNGPVTTMVIDNWRLHMVRNAGMTNAQYIDDVPFNGEGIPDEVLTGIPRANRAAFERPPARGNSGR